LQRVLYRSAKQDPTRRFHALYCHVARSDILWRAWGDVRANRGAPGVDGLAIEAVEESGVAAFLHEIAAALKERSYRPAPLRRVRIPKPGRAGETRPLGIPTLRDRVVMTAAKIVLEPIFEADFLPVSFGFRPKRSAQQALEAIRVEANRGADWVLDADVSDCFGSIDHDALVAQVAPTGVRSADAEADPGVAASGGAGRGGGRQHGVGDSAGVADLAVARQRRPPRP
jgi:retron-type reverse transcriptase